MQMSRMMYIDGPGTLCLSRLGIQVKQDEIIDRSNKIKKGTHVWTHYMMLARKVSRVCGKQYSCELFGACAVPWENKLCNDHTCTAGLHNVRK